MESCHHPAPTATPFRSSCRPPGTATPGVGHPPSTLSQLVRVIEQLKAKDRIISQLEKELGQQSGLAASLSTSSSQLPCARAGQATPSLAPPAPPDPPGGGHGTEAGSESLPHSDPQSGDCGDNGRSQTEKELRELQEHFARLVQEKEEMMRRCREVESKNRQLQERSRRLLEQNVAITSENRSLKDQNRATAQENRKLKDHLETSKSRWVQLSRQLGEEQEARSRLESQSAALQSLKQSLAEQTKTVAALRQTLAEKDRRIELIQHRKKRKRLLKAQGKQSPGVRETFYGYDEDEVSLESETSQSSLSQDTMSQDTLSDEELMEELTKEELEKRLELLSREHRQLQRSHALLTSRLDLCQDPQREFLARQQLEEGLLAAQCRVEDLQRRLQAKEQDEAFQWLLEKESLQAERQALLEKVRLLEAGEAELQQELREARDRSEDLEFRLLELEERDTKTCEDDEAEDEVRGSGPAARARCVEESPGLEAARMEAVGLRRELAELLEARGLQAQAALDKLASLRATEQRLHDLEVMASELQAKVISLQQEKTTLEERLRQADKRPGTSRLSVADQERLANYELKVEFMEKVELQSSRRIQELEESERMLRQQLHESSSPEREEAGRGGRLGPGERERLEEVEAERERLAARVEELEENEEILRENWRRVADEDANRIQCLEHKLKMEQCINKDLKRRLAEAEEAAAMSGARSVGGGASLAAELSQFQSASMPDVSQGHGFGVAPSPQDPTPPDDVMESVLERESALRERIDELENTVEERNSKIEILQEKMASLRESELRLGETVVEMEQQEKALRAKLALYESAAVTVETVLKYEDKIKELRSSQESLLDQIESMERVEEDLQNQYSQTERKLQARILSLERRLADMDRRDDAFITTRASLENQVLQLQERERQAAARTATLELQLKARQEGETAAASRCRQLERKASQQAERSQQLEREAQERRDLEGQALAQYRALEKQDAELSEKLLRVEGEKKELEEEKEEWGREKGELMARVEDLSSEKSQLLAQVEKLESREKELEDELEKMSSEHKLLSDQLDALSSREKQLQTQVEQLSSREKELLAEVDAMSSKECSQCRDLARVRTDRQNLQSQLETLQAELEAAGRDRERWEQERAEEEEAGRQLLEERLAYSEGEKTALMQRLRQLEAERESQQQAAARLEETEADHFAMISSLENQVDALEAERDALGAQSARASAQVEALSGEAARLATEVERLSRDRESHLNEINTLESRHVRQSEQLSRQAAQAQADQAALLEAEERTRELLAQLQGKDGAAAENEARIEELISEVASLERSLQERDSRVQALLSDRSSSEGSVLEKDSEIKNLRDQLSKKEKDLKEKDEELHKLLSNLSSQEKQVVERDNKLSDLLSKLSEQTKAVEERDVKVGELQTRVSSLEQLQSDKSAAVQQLQALQRQVGTLSNEKSELQGKLETALTKASELEKAASEVEELREKVRHLEAVERDVKERYEEEARDHEAARQQVEELKQQVDELQQEKLQLESQVEDRQAAAAELTHLRDQVTKLTSAQQEKSLTSDLASLHTENQELQVKVADLSKVKAALEVRLEASQGQVVRVERSLEVFRDAESRMMERLTQLEEREQSLTAELEQTRACLAPRAPTCHTATSTEPLPLPEDVPQTEALVRQVSSHPLATQPRPSPPQPDTQHAPQGLHAARPPAPQSPAPQQRDVATETTAELEGNGGATPLRAGGLFRRVQELEEENRGLTARVTPLEGAEAQCRMLREKVRVLEAGEERLMDRVVELEQQEEQLAKQLDRLRQQQAGSDTDSGEAGQLGGEAENSQAEQEAAALQGRLDEVERERGALDARVLQLEAACRQAEEKAALQQQALDQASRRCRELESALQEREAAGAAQLSSAKEEAAALEEEASLARQQAWERCRQLEEELAEREERVQELDAQVDGLAAAKSEAEAELARLKSAHQDLLSRARDFTRAEETVSAELAAERRKVQELREELRRTQQQAERVRKESESRVSHLAAEGKQLKEEVNRLRQRTRELERAEKELQAAVSAHRQRERQLEEELSSARTQLKRASEDKEASPSAAERPSRHVSQMLAQFGGGGRGASQPTSTSSSSSQPAARRQQAAPRTAADQVDSGQQPSLLGELCQELDCGQTELLSKLRHLLTSRRTLQRKLEYLESTKAGPGGSGPTLQGGHPSPRVSPGPSPRAPPSGGQAASRSRSPAPAPAAPAPAPAAPAAMLERPEDLLRKQISDLQQLEQHLRQQVADLETDREELHEIARRDKSVIHDQNVRIRELQLSESTLRAQVAQYEQAERELYERSERLEEERAGLEARVRELQILERRLRDLVRQLRLDEERWMARNDNMEATVEELSATEASLKAQLELVEKEREALSSRAETLGARLAAMQGSEAQLTSHVLQFESQHVSLQSRLAHLEKSEAMAHSRASELDAVNQDLNQRLSAAAQENAALLQHVSHLQAQVERLDRELLRARDEAVGRGQEAESLERGQASLQRRLQERELREIESQGQLRQLQQQAAILQDRNSALQRSENKLRHRLQELEASHPLLSGEGEVRVKERLPMTLEDCHRRILGLQRKLEHLQPDSTGSTDSSSQSASKQLQEKGKSEEVQELHRKIDSYRVLFKGLRASLSRDVAPALWDSDPEGLAGEGEEHLPARRLQGAERQRLLHSVAALTPDPHSSHPESATDLDFSDSSTLEEPLAQQVVARTSAAPRPAAHSSGGVERASPGGGQVEPRGAWVAVGRAASLQGGGGARGRGGREEELGLSLALPSESESHSALSRPHSDSEHFRPAPLAAQGATALPRGARPGGAGNSSSDSEQAPPLPASLPPSLPVRGGRAGSHFGHVDVTSSSASARRASEGVASFAPQTAPPSARAAPAPVAMETLAMASLETGQDGSNSAIAAVRGQSIRERIAQIEKQLQTKGSDSKSEDEDSAHAWKTKALVRSRKLETVEKENKHLKDEIQKLETELEGKRRYIQTVQKWMSELDETIKNKEHKPDRQIVQQLQSALCTIRTELQSCAAHHDNTPDNAALRSQLSQQQRQIAAKEREVDVLLRELGGWQREARELEEMRATALDSLRSLELELLALQEADSQLRSLQHSYSSLRSQFEEMEMEKNSALSSMTPLKAKVGRLMRRCKDKDDLIRRLGGEVRRVRGGGKPSPLLEELAKLETAAAGDTELSTLLTAGAWQQTAARRGSGLTAERDGLLSSPSSASDEAEPYSDTELLALSQTWAPRRPKSADQERRGRRHAPGSRSSRGVRGQSVTPGGVYVAVTDYTPGLLSHSGQPQQELAVREGDVVTVTGPVDSSTGYCRVEVRGQSGLVPADYLHPLSQSPALRQALHPPAQTPQGELDGVPEKLARLHHQLHHPSPLPPASEVRAPHSQLTCHATQTSTGSSPQQGGPAAASRKGGVPDPPTNFQVVRSVGDYGVLVSWQPPELDALGRSNGSQVTGYKIYLDGQVYQQAHSPYLAKAILEHLPSGRGHRLALQTVAASGLASPPVELVWQGSTCHLDPPGPPSPSPSGEDLASALAPHHFDQKQKRVFMGMYDYEPLEHAPPGYNKLALAFRAGDLLLVYGDMRKDGFYYGEVEGRRGLIAHYFAEEVPATLKSKPTSSTPASQRSPRPPNNSGHPDTPASRSGHQV